MRSIPENLANHSFLYPRERKGNAMSMYKTNRPPDNLDTYRLLKCVTKSINWAYAIQLTFVSDEAMKQFIKSTYAQSFFYFDVHKPRLRSSKIHRTADILYAPGSESEPRSAYFKFPRPGYLYCREIAYNFLDGRGYLIYSHNQTV